MVRRLEMWLAGSVLALGTLTSTISCPESHLDPEPVRGGLVSVDDVYHRGVYRIVAMKVELDLPVSYAMGP
jgi:hypothetical protein